jgi:hypothetical protein
VGGGREFSHSRSFVEPVGPKVSKKRYVTPKIVMTTEYKNEG